MKKILFISLLFLPMLAFGQLQADADRDIETALRQPAGNMLFGWIDTSKLDIHHSFSSTYMGFGGGSMLLNSYVGTLSYQFADPLLMRVKVGVMNSPLNSFKNNQVLNTLDRARFFGGAELQYSPTDNMSLTVGVESTPYAPLYYYSPFRTTR